MMLKNYLYRVLLLLYNLCNVAEIFALLAFFDLQFESYKLYHLGDKDWIRYAWYFSFAIVAMFFLHTVKHFIKKRTKLQIQK